MSHRSLLLKLDLVYLSCLLNFIVILVFMTLRCHCIQL